VDRAAARKVLEASLGQPAFRVPRPVSQHWEDEP
jgi:hypothetical protein